MRHRLTAGSGGCMASQPPRTDQACAASEGRSFLLNRFASVFAKSFNACLSEGTKGASHCREECQTAFTTCGREPALLVTKKQNKSKKRHAAGKPSEKSARPGDSA